MIELSSVQLYNATVFLSLQSKGKHQGTWAFTEMCNKGTGFMWEWCNWGSNILCNVQAHCTINVVHTGRFLFVQKKAVDDSTRRNAPFEDTLKTNTRRESFPSKLDSCATLMVATWIFFMRSSWLHICTAVITSQSVSLLKRSGVKISDTNENPYTDIRVEHFQNWRAFLAWKEAEELASKCYFSRPKGEESVEGGKSK